MYFFYLDESGSRDPGVGTPEKPKDHLYVLLALVPVARSSSLRDGANRGDCGGGRGEGGRETEVRAA